MTSLQSELDALSWDALCAQKEDLEARLARFQQAFYHKHGRNPAGEELAPAKPAIKRYRAVCKEISLREQEAAELYAQQKKDEERRREKQAAYGGSGMAEAAAHGAQNTSMTVSGAAVERAQTRGRGQSRRQTAAQEDEHEQEEEHQTKANGAPGDAQANSVATVDSTAMASSVDNVGSGGERAMTCASMMPSSSSVEIFANGMQYLQLTYALLATGVDKMVEKLPDFNMELVAPWYPSWSSWLGWLSIFNLDFQMLALYYPDLGWMRYLSWETEFMWIVVLTPLLVGMAFFLLTKSITSIVWLSVLIMSIMVLVFGIAARTSVPNDKQVIMESYFSYLDFLLLCGGVGIVACLGTYSFNYIRTLTEVRRMLTREVDDLSDTLQNVRDGGGDGQDGTAAGEVQESQLHAADIADILDERATIVGDKGALSAAEFVKQMKEAQLANQLRREGREGEAQMPTLYSFFKTLSLWLLVSILALLAWLKRAESLPDDLGHWMPAIDPELSTLSWVALIGSALILVYKFLSLSTWGIGVIDAVTAQITAVYILLLMLTSSLLYVPITKRLVEVWICDAKRCATGEWYPLPSPTFNVEAMFSSASVASDRLLLDSLAGVTGTCEPCAFLAGGVANRSSALECPAAFSDELCPSLTTSRLRASPDLDCESDVWPYYGTASLLMMLAFSVGTPVVYYTLVTQHCDRYESLNIFATEDGRGGRLSMTAGKAAAPGGGGGGGGGGNARASVGGASDDLNTNTVPGAGRRRSAAVDARAARKAAKAARTDDERNDEWARRVKPSKLNKAKSLYADFEYKWRYWKLVILGQKLLLVFVVMFAVDEPLVGACLMGLVHFAMLFCTCWACPYMDARPDQFSISISFANVFNSAVAACAFAEVSVPEYMSYVLLFVNIVLPILMIGWGFKVNSMHEHRKKREADERGEAYVSWRKYKAVDENAAVKRQRRLVERNINEYTLRFLVNWMGLLVLASCLGGGFIAFGSFAKVVTTPVQGASSPSQIPSTVDACAKEEFMRSTEYVGFDSWGSFTQHCCCMPRTPLGNATGDNFTDPSSLDLSEYATELWACTGTNRTSLRTTEGITYKERPRRSVEMAAPMLREFCGLTFVGLDGAPLDVQEPQWNADLQKFGLPYATVNGTDAFFTDYW